MLRYEAQQAVLNQARYGQWVDLYVEGLQPNENTALSPTLHILIKLPGYWEHVALETDEGQNTIIYSKESCLEEVEANKLQAVRLAKHELEWFQYGASEGVSAETGQFNNEIGVEMGSHSDGAGMCFNGHLGFKCDPIFAKRFFSASDSQAGEWRS